VEGLSERRVQNVSRKLGCPRFSYSSCFGGGDSVQWTALRMLAKPVSEVFPSVAKMYDDSIFIWMAPIKRWVCILMKDGKLVCVMRTQPVVPCWILEEERLDTQLAIGESLRQLQYMHANQW